MGSVNRLQRLLVGVLTVWCLGCDAFEIVAESFATTADEMSTEVTTIGAADDCHCVLGHVAVVFATPTAQRPALTVGAFADSPLAAPLPPPEPPLRPPVA